MKLAHPGVKLASLALLPLALLASGAQASATPAAGSGNGTSSATGSSATASASSTSAFSVSALRSHALTDVSGFSAQSPQGKVLKTQGFAVMRAPSGQLAIVDGSMTEQGITSAAGQGFVDLSWQGYAAGARYVVVRDGQEVAALAAGVTSFHDTAVAPGTVHEYRIAPVLPKSGAVGAGAWGMKVAVPRVARGADALNALRAQALSRATTANVAATTTLTWLTFIPQSRIDAPPVGCDYGSGYQFAGDGHTSFDWRNPNYRTSLNAVITWSNKSVQAYKNVHASHVYRKSTGQLIATKTATDKDMKAWKLGSDGNSVDVRMVTHATNPFCNGLGGVKGAIDGAFQMHLTMGGDWSIHSGTHRLMPNHYIYIYDGGRVTNVYERTYASAACLIGSIACDLADLTGYYGSF